MKMQTMRGWATAIGLAIALSTPVAAQTIFQETQDQLRLQLDDLKVQLAESSRFVTEEAEPRLLEQAALIKSAPEDTDRMIADLEALVDKFKAGSEINLTVQESIVNASEFYDKYREGTEAQQRAAEIILASRQSLEESDGRRDELVGEAMAAISMLKVHKEDLVALQIAGAYEEMADIYRSMIDSFESTVTSSVAVADSIAKAADIPTE